jgi:hypothetical protein
VDTWFWPVIQAGVLGIKEEEAAIDKVWRAVRESHGENAAPVEVDLTSGYFGLYKAYKRAVIESPAPVRVIAASPKVSRAARRNWRTNPLHRQRSYRRHTVVVSSSRLVDACSGQWVLRF